VTKAIPYGQIHGIFLRS